jgi:hypothetical protein
MGTNKRRIEVTTSQQAALSKNLDLSYTFHHARTARGYHAKCSSPIQPEPPAHLRKTTRRSRAKRSSPLPAKLPAHLRKGNIGSTKETLLRQPNSQRIEELTHPHPSQTTYAPKEKRMLARPRRLSCATQTASALITLLLPTKWTAPDDSREPTHPHLSQ